MQLFLSRLPVVKNAFLSCFIKNWEENESLKIEKSPGIVLEKSWNSVFPFPYEPCEGSAVFLDCRFSVFLKDPFFQIIK